MKELYELVGQGLSIRTIAKRLSISRNTVRKYLRSPGVPKFSPGPPRPSKLDAFREHVLGCVRDGVEKCVVLLRELKGQGYGGSYAILIQPLRVRASVNTTMRFETVPGYRGKRQGTVVGVKGKGYQCRGCKIRSVAGTLLRAIQRKYYRPFDFFLPIS